MATTISAPFGTLPHYLQQRVLAGVLYHDHKATAAACKGFRAIIRGPGFLALRQRHGFAERVVVVVGNKHLAHRIIVFMENGSAFARAANGSWATYEGAAAVGPPVFGLLAPQHYVSESVLLG